MPNQNSRASSYRRAFGAQTAYSTAGSKQWGNLDPSIQDLINKKRDQSNSHPNNRGSNPDLNEGLEGSSINEEFKPKNLDLDNNNGSNDGLGMGGSGNQNNMDKDIGYGLQLSQPMYPSMIIGKTNEKDQLSNLNSRFQSYIQKVRSLEDQNKRLEEKIKERTKRATETRVKQEDVEEIFQYRKQIDDLTVHKANFQVERDNLRGDAMELKQKLEEENQTRNELDDELTRLRKDVDDATMVRTDLERKIETLREELEYNRKVHHEEQKQLKKQIEQQGCQVEVDGITPDISEMLRQIRAQYDQISIKHRDEAEQWYKKKCEDLEIKQKNNAKDLEKTTNEINEYRRQVTHLEMELESLRGTNEYLERNLQDVEKRYELDLSNHQNRLNRMQNDLDKATNELKRHIAEYKNLMTIKLTLDKELAGYQTMLDEEDNIEERGPMQMLGGPKLLKVSSEDSQSSSSSDESVQVQTTKRVFIKTIESKDGRVTNQRVEEREDRNNRNLDRSMGSLNINPRSINISGSSSRDDRNMNLQNMNQREQQIPRQNQIPVAGSVKSRTSKFEAVNQSQAQAAAQEGAQNNRTNQYVSISGNNSAVLRRKQIARPKSSSSSDSDSSSDSSGSTDSSDSEDSSD